VFDIGGGEFLVLAVIALVVLGPEKLPGYAAQAARMLRQLRTMADGAKDQMREQMGPEFDDIDWKSLDPRQYDPRRMVREALAGGDAEAEDEKPVSKGAPRPHPIDDDDASEGASKPVSAYDDEAT
jgi:sec-independent protein translocase protein TatB